MMQSCCTAVEKPHGRHLHLAKAHTLPAALARAGSHSPELTQGTTGTPAQPEHNALSSGLSRK